MSKQLKVNPCTKCGDDEYNLKTTYEENKGITGKVIVFISLTATCKRCGWLWYITPLDDNSTKTKGN